MLKVEGMTLFKLIHF